MRYLEVNNFFQNPDSILELTKTLEFYNFQNHPESSVVGRMLEREVYNYIIFIQNFLKVYVMVLCLI